MNSNNSKCKKCGCSGFSWNPCSAGQKLMSGGQVTVYDDPVVVTIKGQPMMDNKTDQAAYRNCLCGHHYNYHS